MRIVVGKPVCPEHTIHYMIDAIRELGHEIIWGDEGMSLDKGYDMVFIMQFSRIDPRLIGGQYGFWYTDEGTKVSTNSAGEGISPQEMCEKASHVFVGVKQDIDYVKEFNDNVSFLSFACDSTIHRPFNMERIADVAFVGSELTGPKEYPSYRRALLDKLSMNGIEVRKYIDHKRKLLFKNMSKFYCQAPLAFNWSARGGLNMRVYETMAMERVLLTNRWGYDDWIEPDMYFEDGKELIVYDTPSDLVKKCRRLLDNEEEMNEIGKNARDAVLNGHTYRDRMIEVIDTMKEYNIQ